MFAVLATAAWSVLAPADGGLVHHIGDALSQLGAADQPVTASEVLAPPHVIDDAVSDVLVRLRGGACTGTPITGTVYVVTAAHCVLTESGEATQRTIVRDQVTYTAVGVLVDTRYHDHPTTEHDAAVLVMADVIPGPSARLGDAIPRGGQVTVAGFQPIDSRGALLRGHESDIDPIEDASGTRVERPAGCVVPVDSLDVSASRVMVGCGLVPGASGGGLYAEDDGGVVLVGILSTVTADLSTNGIVPMTSLLELIDHPDHYLHEFSSESGPHERGSL